MKKQFIRDLTPGESVRDVFVLAEARQSQARNGPFWSLKLQDATGGLEAKIFAPASLQYPSLTAGVVAEVQGQVQTYRDQPQVLVERLEVLEGQPPPELLRQLVPCSAVPPETLLAELEALVMGHLRHGPWRTFVRSALGDASIREPFLAAPGAKAIHHAYAGGLVEHTLAVAKVCAALAELYPRLDRQVLMVGATFHDLGKAWELNGGLARDYTTAGRLLGHLYIGLEKLAPHLAASGLADELQLHFKHLVLSHHGEYEYGSPRRPKTAEALALHYADNIDAKMATVGEALEGVEEDGWSGYVRPLERYLHRPVATPVEPGNDPGTSATAGAPAGAQDDTPAGAPAGAQAPQDQLCLFPSKA